MRMPFGFVCAQDIFKQKMEETFSSLEGLSVIEDDIITSDKNDKHDRNLLCVLERARKEGVKFNPEKCIFGVPSIPNFGHIITAENIRPDPRKVEALKDLPYPTSKEELITSLEWSVFYPGMSQISRP